MEKFLENLKSWIVIWLWFLIVVFLWWTIYAAIDSKSEWDTLKSSDWNKIVSQVNALPWMIVAFNSNTCPDGWLPADWSANVWWLDLRWVFIRWANNFGSWANNRDEDRANSGSGVLTYQEDAIRNITWRVNIIDTRIWIHSWAFVPDDEISYIYNNGVRQEWYSPYLKFDASYAPGVKVWTDNRPKNIALIYCVKQ